MYQLFHEHVLNQYSVLWQLSLSMKTLKTTLLAVPMCLRGVARLLDTVRSIRRAVTSNQLLSHFLRGNFWIQKVSKDEDLKTSVCISVWFPGKAPRWHHQDGGLNKLLSQSLVVTAVTQHSWQCHDFG